jgi:hypothetical protein
LLDERGWRALRVCKCCEKPFTLAVGGFASVENSPFRSRSADTGLPSQVPDYTQSQLFALRFNKLQWRAATPCDTDATQEVPVQWQMM